MKKFLPIAALATLVICTIVRIYFICTTMVIDDESYYYVWTNHLAWGYIDGGPTIAFINKLFVMLFGVNGFSVRIGGVLLVTIASIYLYYWGTKRYSQLVGFLLLLLLSITPACFVSSIIHTYDTEMVVFMLAAIALYYDAYFVDKRFFYPAGAALGLAMLSKISVLFPAIGILIFSFVHKPMREHLRKKEFYLSFLIAALIFLPFIVWNFTHDFAFIRFKGGMAYRHGGLGDFINVWTAQLPLYLPTLCWYAIGVPIGIMISWLRRKRVPSDDLYFALIAIIPILYFGIGSYFSRYYGNWVAPVFFSGLLLMPICLSRNWKSGRVTLGVHLALSVVMLMAIVGQVYLDFLPIHGDGDITNRYYQYSAIPEELKPYLDKHPELQKIRIVGNNYQIPSMVNMYVRPKIEAAGLSLGDYHKTLYTMLYPGKAFANKPLLLLNEGEEFPKEFRPYFSTVEKKQTFISRRHGEEVGRFTLWYVTGYRGRSEKT